MSATAREMIQRRRERMTLEALQGLVVHLGGIREERKAVLAVSEGWILYQRTAQLTDADRWPGTVGSTPGDDERCRSRRAATPTGIALSQEDHVLDFRRMLDDANRANVSFYPLDPRGLVVFDTPLSAKAPSDLVTDAARLRARLDSLQTMADNTDGLPS